MAAFKLTDLQRNRTLAWDKAGNKGAGKAVTTSDLMKDDGVTPDPELCAKYGVDPKAVTYLTIDDLPEAFRKSATDAVRALAAEWSQGAKDADGKPVKWTPDEVAWYLVIQSRLQDAANASIKAHRPVSDKALDKAVFTIIRNLKGQGKTQQEIASFLKMGGMEATDKQIADAFQS